MKFIGQCIVANAPEKPRGKFRVMKSITKPTSGFLKIVNGEYLTPTYTPPTPPTNNPSNDPTIERVEVQTISSDGTLSAINLKVKLVNNDTKLLTFYAHASTESNVSFYDLSTTWASNKKSVDLSANSELSSHTFKFDHVGLKNGSVVSISDNQSLNNPNPPSMYYIYVFVTDSDDEEFTYNESITINR
jgi:hypothetical protein